MDYSKRTSEIMAEYAIDSSDVAYAELLALGWNKSEAAFVAYKPKLTVESDVLKFAKKTEMLHPGIVRYSKALKEKLVKKQTKTAASDSSRNTISGEDGKSYDLLTKDGMLEYLVDLSNNPGLDLKSKTDLAKQISDLMQFKKEEVKIEDNRIHFYLPLTCAKCGLYKAHKEKQEQESQN